MAEGLPSLKLLLELVQQERDRQLAHFEALDNKAGVSLGFAGLLIALASDIDGWSVAIGMIAAVAAAALSLAAFWPRRLPMLRPQQLRRYLEADERFTALRVHDTVVKMVEDSTRLLEAKAQRLRWALVSLAAAATAFATGIVVSAIGRI